MTKFKIGAFVIYRGKTYTFTGRVCGVTDDGQYIVSAINSVDPIGAFNGMKHIYGKDQLDHWYYKP